MIHFYASLSCPQVHTAQPTELPSASIQMWWIEDAFSIGGVCQVTLLDS